MTNEQRDKTINFIFEQRAKVATNLQQLAEAGSAAEERISRMEGAIVTVVNMIGESNKRTDARIAELNEKWKETTEIFICMNRRLEEGRELRRRSANCPVCAAPTLRY
jgi:hypothetical protein